MFILVLVKGIVAVMTVVVGRMMLVTVLVARTMVEVNHAPSHTLSDKMCPYKKVIHCLMIYMHGLGNNVHRKILKVVLNSRLKLRLHIISHKRDVYVYHFPILKPS